MDSRFNLTAFCSRKPATSSPSFGNQREGGFLLASIHASHPPDGLMLQGVRVRGVHCQQHTAHRDILLSGHHHGVRVEDWTLVDIQDRNVDSRCGAGAIGDVWYKWVLIFHFDQQGVKGRDLIIQGLGKQTEGRQEGTHYEVYLLCTQSLWHCMSSCKHLGTVLGFMA